MYEPWGRNHRCVSTQTLPFSATKTLNLNQIWIVLTSLWPKTQVCLVVDHSGTNKKPILLHQQGLWTLSWESEMHFHSSLTIFYPSNPQFEANLASFDAFSPTKISMLSCRYYRGIRDALSLHSHHFLPIKTTFWSKFDFFWRISDQKISMLGCRSCTHQ